jgi:predicted O-methyltransferase YrrM
MTRRGAVAGLAGAVLADRRTRRLRSMARGALRRAARAVDPDASPAWVPSDPFASFPEPSLSRHALLKGLHERVAPERYLEIGVFRGDSLTLARCLSIGVDPDFKITRELHTTTHLYRTTSDEFFTRDNPLGRFEGRPIDLAFIDGMHLAEFALRDFINVERHMAPGGVVVLDDVLPRNALEAARDRRTDAWAGDVYKVVTVLRQHRPDLAVVPVNTRPTGVVVVVGLDPSSTVLRDRYDELLPLLTAPDPQEVPQDLLDRSSAVDPGVLLDSVDWDLLHELRQAPPGDPQLRALVDGLARLPCLG